MKLIFCFFSFFGYVVLYIFFEFKIRSNEFFFIRFNFISYTWFKFKFQFNSRDLSIIQSKNALKFSTNRANINCMKKCISTSKLAIYWHFIWKLAICWENYIEWFERKLLWIVICDEKRLKILARNKWRISLMLLKNVYKLRLNWTEKVS